MNSQNKRPRAYDEASAARAQRPRPARPNEYETARARASSVRPGANAQRTAARPAPYAPRAASNARPVQSARRAAQNARPVQAARPAAAPKKNSDFGKKAAAFLKKAGKILWSFLRAFGLILLTGAGAAITGAQLLNKKLDFFRKTEATRIITNCAVGCVIASLVICLILLVKPSFDASRARSLAEKGKSAEAVRIVEKLEKDGYREKKLIKTKLSVAESLIAAEKFEEASGVLASMEKSESTQALSNKLSYEKAQSLYKGASFSAAAQLFYQNPEYLDSLERYYDCRCALAIEAYLNGQENLVQGLLLDIPNVAMRIQSVARETAKDDQQLQLILSSEAFNEETLKHFENSVTLLTSMKDSASKGRIAAGYRHTLGLAADGRVYAAGDNSYGQSNVSRWSNVVQVAAGAYHSVALFADGTVDAMGDNSQNQLDVYEWTDIVAVAASAYSTIGLKSDGSVVACGMHADLVSGWHGVTMITGGAHSAGCLYDKGYMLSTHKSAQMDMSAVLFDLSVSGSVAAGILYDGSLITNVENAPEWKDIVFVEASSTCLLAIDTSGNVLSHFYRADDAAAISVPARAVEIVSCGTHHVVLLEDGRVIGFGNNDYGQLNVQNWSL